MTTTYPCTVHYLDKSIVLSCTKEDFNFLFDCSKIEVFSNETHIVSFKPQAYYNEHITRKISDHKEKIINIFFNRNIKTGDTIQIKIHFKNNPLSSDHFKITGDLNPHYSVDIVDEIYSNINLN